MPHHDQDDTCLETLKQGAAQASLFCSLADDGRGELQMVTSKYYSRSLQKSPPSCYLQSLSCFIDNRDIEELITKILYLNSSEGAAYDLHMNRN